MVAKSAGLGCGTTVYFELPLFCAAMAGKEQVTPFNTVPDQTSPPQPTITNEVLLNGQVSPSKVRVLLEPAEMGSRMPASEAANYEDDDIDAIASLVVRPKPTKPGSVPELVDFSSPNFSLFGLLSYLTYVGIIEAWEGRPKIAPNRFQEQSVGIESVPDMESLDEVSRVLEFGSGGIGDDGPQPHLPAPSSQTQQQDPQMSFLIVVL